MSEKVTTQVTSSNTMNKLLYDNMNEIINMLNKKPAKTPIESVVSEIDENVYGLRTLINARNNAIQEFYQKYKNNETITKIATDMQAEYQKSINPNVRSNELYDIRERTKDWYGKAADEARKAADEAEAARKAADEAEAARKAADEAAEKEKEDARLAEEKANQIKAEEEKKAKEKEAYTLFKKQVLNVLQNIKPTQISVPVEPVIVQYHYEEFKCKALQHMQQILLGHLKTDSYYNEFKLKAIQIMHDKEAQKAEADKQAAIEAAEAAINAAKLDTEKAKHALTESTQSAKERINNLYYEQFKTKALEKMREIQYVQESINKNYEMFVLKATAVINSVATQGLNEKIKDNADRINATADAKNKLEQESLFKEFKHQAELVLIRSQAGDISKQLAEHKEIIETDNYNEFKLKAQLYLTQSMLESKQKVYLEKQQVVFYEDFKTKALGVLNDIFIKQSLYDKFKKNAMVVMNNIQKVAKIHSLTEQINYEEFKKKALNMMVYSNPELGSTEWVSAL